MSREIMYVQKDNATSSTKEAQHSSDTCTIQPWDLLDVRMACNLEVSAHLIGGDYHTKQYLASEKGHLYVKQFNPTLDFVKPLLEKMKEPSVLLLRSCEFLLQLPFDKFKSITTLEISGCRQLTTFPENTISQMTHLQILDLSYLQINHLPDDMFVNNANSLRSLVLRGCSDLHVLPQPPRCMIVLEYLDLSHLPIQSLPKAFISARLRFLILRGCSKLRSFRPFLECPEIHFLDLCHCTSLIDEKIFLSGTIKVLDLSNTDLGWDSFSLKITHLFYRNGNLQKIESSSMNDIKVCDLSGNQGLVEVRMLEDCRCLEALNLSKTGIESIDFISELTSLRTIVLSECTKLKQLPTIEQLENLEVLDLSGCEIMCDLPHGLSKQRRLKELNLCGCKGLAELREGLFDDMLCLEKLDLSNTCIKNLSSFANRINRGTVINHSCDSVLESSTIPMELKNLRSENFDSRHEFHLVSNFITNSGFDNFKYRFTELNCYLMFLEEKIIKSVVDIEARGAKRSFQSMHVDLEYILEKVDLLESSQNCKSSEDLLHQLMSYDYQNYDDDPSTILKKLIQTVAKLKLLVPHLPPKLLSMEEGRKKLFSLTCPSVKRNEELVDDYESLTSIQKNCLLYFACLSVPITGKNSIKESILIHLWYGEGFFDPLLYANSTSNLIPDMSCGSPDRKDANEQASTSNTNRTIEDVGRDILDALQKRKFIWSETGGNKWQMVEWFISFGIKKAMEEHLFDFNERGKLTPHFGVSKRAFMLKSAIDHPPSSRVWLNYTKTSGQLESFKTVRTLLYIDERVVDINTKWFSSMTELHVLHLVNLNSGSEQINIVDLEFLEELKRMKQLRLLNLESFAAIQKLPDSICQLTNLRILNLAYCSNLTELPAGIASLTNLIILDLTQCHLLSELPKGLSSLSKLEVLKGFPITYKVSGRQSKRACTLRELLKLESLRKLNLTVNKESFPDAIDLQVLRSMKELHNLKITWKQNICKEEELSGAVEKGALRQSRWKQFKCWGLHNETDEAEEDELLLTNTCLGNLNKLVLCCVPFETEPNWLHPTELQNLERLYIVGGNVRTLFQDFTEQTTWNIKALKLKYLSNLHMDWLMIYHSFPSVTSCREYGCPHVKEFYLEEFYVDPYLLEEEGSSDDSIS